MMTKAIPSSRHGKPYLTLLLCLNATDEKPPLATILHAAALAIRRTADEGDWARDEPTVTEAKCARAMLGQALVWTRHGEHRHGETLAADALELTIRALRRVLEIEAGLRQPLTASELYGREVPHENTTRLGEDGCCRVEERIAAWRALSVCEASACRERSRRTVWVNVRVDQVLDQIGVPPLVRRWLDARSASEDA